MSEKLLELKNITKCYKKQTALENVSFSIEKGHVYGFVGENGAGKTTTLRIITGLAKQTSLLFMNILESCLQTGF